MSGQPRLEARRLPEAPTQVIDRSKGLTFTFDGRRYQAFAGDTIASALAAAGVTTFSRSFKYHRRRSLLCLSGNCPNCLVRVGGEPNVRACLTPVRQGMQVRSQNAWPSRNADVMSLTQMVSRFLPVGFYYKAFMRPRRLWPLYEQVLRRAAGLGKVGREPPPGAYEKAYRHAEVAVIGGGPAGLSAALAAAKAGARVLLLEAEPQPGGHLRYTPYSLDGQPVHELARSLSARAQQHPNVEVLSSTLAIGYYGHHWIGALQGDRLLKLRAGAVVVASGAYENPLVFENNDLPGVILGSGVDRLVHLWGVRPGERAVVVSANPRGLHTALGLHRAGIQVAAVAELRGSPEAALVERLRACGVRLLPGTTVEKVFGRGRLRSVALRSPQGGQRHELSADLLVLAAGFTPANELLFQAGGALAWDESINEFTPRRLPPGVFAAGEVAGTHSLTETLREGELAGLQAAAAAGFERTGSRREADALREQVERRRQRREPWTPESTTASPAKNGFVCLCEDVSQKDIHNAIDEGYESIELLKRYSTVSMGPCQGKMCNMAAMRICAAHNGDTIRETGTTTSRPPVRPVPLGALGGRRLEPLRVTPMHAWHLAHGAEMMNAGLWKRPEHYGDPSAEVRAVRQAVGLIDVSTLGKIHLHGPDVPALLERLYTNRWRKLRVGRVRYGVMVNEEGTVMDDGVTARLAEELYYMTTTSGGARSVYEWILWWQQSGWPFDVENAPHSPNESGSAAFDVHVLDATELRAAMNLAGPRARQVLAKVVEGADISPEAFPYMHVRQARVAGAPALLLRIGFTGELSYEIHTPSGYGLQVWEALMEAGEEFGIRPFGVEAQRVLRLEKGHLIVGQDTDALTDPFEAGMGWAVKLEKEDFLGRPSLAMAEARGVAKQLVGFEVPDGALPEEASQIVRRGNGPLGYDIIGRITSARRSPTLDKVIGLCWLPAEMARPGQEFSIRVRGEIRRGRVTELPFYDPAGERLRS